MSEWLIRVSQLGRRDATSPPRTSAGKCFSKWTRESLSVRHFKFTY